VSNQLFGFLKIFMLKSMVISWWR